MHATTHLCICYRRKLFFLFFSGLTTGSPIKVEVPNTGQRGDDYSEMSLAYRPSHADATYDLKSSARETIGRVAAGAVAKKILKQYSGTEIIAYVSQAHKVVLPEDLVDHETVTLDQIESNIVRCPNPEYAEKMIAAIDAVRVRRDSVGGVVTCIVRNVTRGLGSPVFDKLEAELAKAVMSIPATNGFVVGSGFAGWNINGEIIKMRIAFKPTAYSRGRHDPCVAPRAVPVVETMVAEPWCSSIN
ncbi:Chorismate synthase [Abeliophyllum distichum]|uniref:chorismate synthase n=1 Tax=Abeliophyllum distichum TaxID=126358 RepID=A0ABD1VR52_9LAMI